MKKIEIRKIKDKDFPKGALKVFVGGKWKGTVSLILKPPYPHKFIRSVVDCYIDELLKKKE